MSEIVNIVGAKILALLLRPIRRRFLYLSNYRENVENLRRYSELLEAMRNDVRKTVDVAQRNGQVNTNEVIRWLVAVDDVSESVRQLFDGMEDGGHVGSNLCIHFRSIYRTSKEAERIAMSITELRENVRFLDVLSPPSRRMMEPRFFGDFELSESQKTTVSEVMEALKDDNINIIGICGMGGLGKTVLVRQVGKQVKESGFFDTVVMVDVFQSPDVRRIQGEIADMLGLKLNEESSLGRARIFQRLLHERVLVILDDVWNIIDLEEVGIPLMNNAGYGCKILITSRSLDVCNGIGSEKICSINALSEEEAWGLFRDILGDSGESPDLLSVAREIVHECAGLPLAIVTIARTLKNRSIYVWKDALEQLRRRTVPDSIQESIQGQLEISYNFLESYEAKVMFLLCCLFPEDADISIDCLMSYGTGLRLFHDVDSLKETRDRVETLVDQLKSLFLLLDSESHGCVRMHDVIRDVGVSIASRDHQFFIQSGFELKKWPENKSITAISLRYKAISELPNRLEYPKLNLLVLECNHPSLRLPTDFFKGTRELKVLHLSDMLLLSLPSSLQFLVNLRALFFTNCKLSDLSIIGMLRELEILSFSGSDIKELLEGVRQLNCLKLLDLTRCDKLVKIVPQAISNLSRLEVLYMKNCFVEWEIGEEGKERSNASLAELMSLSCLNTLEIHIPDAKFLPESKLFLNLIKFAISIGSRFEEWENYPSSRTLKLMATPLNDRVIALLGRAEAIYLNGFNGLKYDNDNLQKKNFFECKFLRVENCDGLEDIFNIVEESSQTVSFSSSIVALGGGQIRPTPFCKLSILEVTNCGLKYLLSTSSARCLAQLRELKVKECKILEEILAEEKGDNDDKIEFSQLRILRLACLPKFTSFRPKLLVSKEDVDNATQPLFNEMVAFPSLEVVSIYGLDQLRQVCGDQFSAESFRNLRVVSIVNYEKLLNFDISNVVERFQNLEELTVMRCGSQEDVFELAGLDSVEGHAIALSRVTELTLWGKPDWMHRWNKGFPENFGFPNLTKLEVWKCRNSKNLLSLSMARCLKQLQVLRVNSCPLMEEIVAKGREEEENTTIVAFNHLNSLLLSNLPKLTSFCSGQFSLEFSSLETLAITQCPKMKAFAHGSISSQKLKIIDGEFEETNSVHVSQLHHFFDDKVVPFPRLVEMKLSGMGDLKEIWHDEVLAESFGELKILEFEKCESLLKLIPLTLIESLCVEELTVKECGSLEVIFDPKGLDVMRRYYRWFSNIKKLRLVRLPQLNHMCKKDPLSMEEIGTKKFTSLFSSSVASCLVTLQVLEIIGCDMVEEIIDEEGDVIDGIVFHKVTSLILEDLPNLLSFCTGSLIFKWPSLTTMKVIKCPKLETIASEFTFLDRKSGFTHAWTTETLTTGFEEIQWKDHTKIPLRHLFSGQAAFPGLVKLGLSCMVNLKEIWHGQLPGLSFCKLEVLELDKCDKLQKVFPSYMIQRLQNLEELNIKECGGLEEVFDLQEFTFHEGQVPFSQIKKLRLNRLPKLKCAWKEDAKESEQGQISSLRNLFSPSVAKCLTQLQNLDIIGCELVEEIVAKGGEVIDKIIFHHITSLTLQDLPNLKSFCTADYTFEWPVLKTFEVNNCPKLEKIASGFFITPKLNKMISGFEETLQDDAPGITTKHLFQGQVAVPSLEVLNLYHLGNMKEIWTDPLVILGFQNLSTLMVYKCDSLKNLFSSSMAVGLSQLRVLEISTCMKIEEILAKEKSREAAATNNIKFLCLKTLTLENLPSIQRFCSWNCSFDWPSLERVRVEGCQQMVSFSLGSLHTPKLRAVQVGDSNWLWKGDLNSTIEHLFEGKVLHETTEEFCITGDKLKEILDTKLNIKSFGQLKSLTAKFCDEQLNVFLSILLSRSPQLEKLAVENCSSLEKVFNLEGILAEEGKARFFTRLRELRLHDLPKLMYIWNKDPSGIFDLRNLRDVNVLGCGGLRNLFSSSVSKGLEQLRILKVHTCEMMEEIIAREAEKEEAARENFFFNQLEHIELIGLSSFMIFHLGSCTFEFPCLKILRIEQCPKMKAFTPGFLSMEELVTAGGGIGNTHEGEMNSLDMAMTATSLVNWVAFPEMQELHLICLDNFGKIWQGKVPAGSFSNLRVLEVDTCGNLLNVIPSDLLPRLENLEKLTVQSCKSLKEVFGLHRPVIEKIHDETLLLSKLSKLELINLPNLEHLFSRGFAGTHVLENLQILKVKNCGHLRNLFSPSVARCLKQLYEVEITNCDVMEVVVEEQGGAMIDLILFPELKFLVLENLPCLTTFGPGRIISKFPSFETLRIKNCPGIKTLFSGFDGETRQHLFVPEMPFDRLKELHLIHLGDFQKIWHDELPAWSPIKLSVLIVDSCHKLLNPIPPILLMKLHKLRKLAVERCHSLEHVFDLEGHGIEDVYGNLLPKLRNLVLTDLPNVSRIFKKDPPEVSVFRNLNSLQVINCIGLRYLFSASTARNLEQLQLLKIFGCEAMEQIIANGEAGEKMVFPKLKCLILKSLPNLTSFCQWNCPCEWPSLEIVRVKGVPKMEIFSHGSQSTPRLKAIYVTFLEKCWKGDLNSTMQHIYDQNGGQHGRIGQKILFDNLECHTRVESSSEVLGEQPSTSQEEIEGVVVQDLEQHIYDIGSSKIHEILEEEEEQEEHEEEKEEEEDNNDDEKN